MGINFYGDTFFPETLVVNKNKNRFLSPFYTNLSTESVNKCALGLTELFITLGLMPFQHRRRLKPPKNAFHTQCLFTTVHIV